PVILMLFDVVPRAWSAQMLYPLVPSPNLYRRGLFMAVASLTFLASLRLDIYLRNPVFEWKELRGPLIKIMGLVVMAIASYFIWRGAHLHVIQMLTPWAWFLAWLCIALAWWMAGKPARKSLSWRPQRRALTTLWLVPLLLLIGEQIWFFNHR